MKRFILVVLLVAQAFLFMSLTWQTDFEKAKADAKAQHKFILMNFSGSDWCIPCIHLEKSIFETPIFSQFADSNLIMVKADFPRLKKNQLDKATAKQNEELAELYNKNGHFPLTLLLNAEGKVIKSWEGSVDTTPEDFIIQIRNSCK